MGIADEIGGWVISEACRQAARWQSDLVIGINLSPLQIASGDVVGHIEHALRTTGLPARRLELEITETSLLQSNPGNDRFPSASQGYGNLDCNG